MRLCTAIVLFLLCLAIAISSSPKFARAGATGSSGNGAVLPSRDVETGNLPALNEALPIEQLSSYDAHADIMYVGTGNIGGASLPPPGPARFTSDYNFIVSGRCFRTFA